MTPLKTILYPTDFSKPSECAFKMACSLARDNKARLIILHVTMPVVIYGDGITPIPTVDYKDKIWESFRALQESDPKVRDIRVETRLVEGEAAKEILTAAKETECDVIVLGTHGRTGFRRLLMGSVAEEVVRRASCPVLTVKASMPAAKKEEEPEEKESKRALAAV